MASEIVENIVLMATEIIEKSEELKKDIDEITEWSSFTAVINNINKIIKFFEYVVLAVEEAFSEAAGEDKLEAAAIIIDDMLELPILLELIDRYVIKIVISIVVHYLNEQFGHIWDIDRIKG